MIFFRNKVAPCASFADGFKPLFGNELLESPLQGAFREIEFGEFQQFLHGRAGWPRGDEAAKFLEFLGWNLKWHDCEAEMARFAQIMSFLMLLWHESTNHASKMLKNPLIVPFQIFPEPPIFFRYAMGLMPTACLNCRENAD